MPEISGNQWKLRDDFLFFFMGNDSYKEEKRKMLSPTYQTNINTWNGFSSYSVNSFVNKMIMFINSFAGSDCFSTVSSAKEHMPEIDNIIGNNSSPIRSGIIAKSMIGASGYYNIFRKWYKVLYTIAYCSMFFHKQKGCDNVFMSFLSEKKDKFLFYAHPNDKILGINCSDLYATRNYDGPHRFTGNNYIGCLLMNIRDAHIYKHEKKEGELMKKYKLIVSGKNNFLLPDYVFSILSLNGYEDYIESVTFDECGDLTCFWIDFPRSTNMKDSYSKILEMISMYPGCEIL